LDIKVSNSGRVPVSVSRTSLPWAQADAIILAAVTADRKQKRLDQIFPVQDAMPDVVEIRPGDLASGRVSLTVHFPSLSTVLQRNDVVISWSFQLRGSDGVNLQRQAGGLVLPKDEQTAK
jgi:hypothetical protein